MKIEKHKAQNHNSKFKIKSGTKNLHHVSFI